MTAQRPEGGRALGALGGGAAGSPFAIAAAQHGVVGLVIGAGVILCCAAIGADGIVWPLIMLRMNRQQRWALRQTGSVDDALRLDREARRSLKELIRAKAATPSADSRLDRAVS